LTENCPYVLKVTTCRSEFPVVGDGVAENEKSIGVTLRITKATSNAKKNGVLKRKAE